MNENILHNDFVERFSESINSSIAATLDFIYCANFAIEPDFLKKDINNLIQKYEKTINTLDDFEKQIKNEIKNEKVAEIHNPNSVRLSGNGLVKKIENGEFPLIEDNFYIRLEKPYASQELIKDNRYSKTNRIKRFIKYTFELPIQIKINKKHRNWYHRQVLVTE
ncbi:hypothetical protein HN924_00970 [Candidatus Woesearchaeota archaeon]|jgi:hypothetical protein|nr:hypothetical protein [Candidatus Woesearchaeota archaeon]MBT7402522.1 hypothetical protein [Candidatus Woesearchaeota archaeon]